MNDFYRQLIADTPILLNMDESTSDAVVTRLVTALADVGKIERGQCAACCAAIRARELSSGRTALANGVAIPHARTNEVNELVMALGIHPGGVDCGAIDGNPSHIFTLMLISPAVGNEYLRVLAEINTRLLRPDIRHRILMARTTDAVRALLLAEI